MGRIQVIPDDLTGGPFSLGKARACGLTREDLRGRQWRRVTHGWYCWRGLPAREVHLLIAIAAMLPRGGAFGGLTAARWWGIEAPAPRRPQVVVPDEPRVDTRCGARVRCIRLRAGDVVTHDGFPVTSPARTCFDLAGELSLTEAVAAVDMALHRQLVTTAEVAAYVASHAGVAGVVKARRLLTYVEPLSESPMESRLRMLIVLAGLPRPQAQVELRDGAGNLVARVDFYYPDVRLAIEYDGENHRERLITDNRRQNRLQEMGVRILRFTAADVWERSHETMAQIRRQLH